MILTERRTPPRETRCCSPGFSLVELKVFFHTLERSEETLLVCDKRRGAGRAVRGVSETESGGWCGAHGGPRLHQLKGSGV